MEQNIEAIERAVSVHLPGRTVQAVKDRGVWSRRIVEVTLDGGNVVFFKIELGSPLGTIKEPQVVRLFHDHGLPAPRVLAVDTSCEVIPYPYLVQERLGGARLGDLLDQVNEADALAIYEAMGRFYSRLHAIHYERSGWWVEAPDKPVDVLPNDFMYNAEIVGGSGKRALEQGRITKRTYNRAVALWAKHMDYLKDHRPSLVHGSLFLWTVYLDRDDGDWYITKLMDLNDVLWWDPAYDLAFLRYPPFGEVSAARWEAFLHSYGPAPERKRLLFYAVMQRLCAAMGTYLEPQTARNKAWSTRCLEDVDIFMDEIEPLSPGASPR
jgi:hypothetical protein